MQGRLCRDAIAIDVRAVGRTEIGDRRRASACTHHCVASRDEVVTIEHRCGTGIASEQYFGLIQDHGCADRQNVARDDKEPARRCGWCRSGDGSGLRVEAMARAQNHALGRATDITNRRPRDPPDEEIEQDQHSNAEQEECLIDHRSAVPLLDSQRAHPNRDLIPGADRGAANAATVDHRAVG